MWFPDTPLSRLGQAGATTPLNKTSFCRHLPIDYRDQTIFPDARGENGSLPVTWWGVLRQHSMRARLGLTGGFHTFLMNYPWSIHGVSMKYLWGIPTLYIAKNYLLLPITANFATCYEMGNPFC